MGLLFICTISFLLLPYIVRAKLYHTSTLIWTRKPPNLKAKTRSRAAESSPLLTRIPSLTAFF